MSCVPRFRVLQLVYTFMSGRILDACQIWEINNYADILVKSQQWDHRWVASLLPSRNISVYNDSSLPTYVKVLADSLFISTLYGCVFILADVLCLPRYCIWWVFPSWRMMLIRFMCVLIISTFRETSTYSSRFQHWLCFLPGVWTFWI